MELDITKEDLLEADATELVRLQRHIVQLQTELASRKASWLEMNGPGSTYELPNGCKITITRATEGRPTGTLEPVFDVLKFSGLPDETRAVLLQAGVVRLEPKMIRGMPAQVKLIGV